MSVAAQPEASWVPGIAAGRLFPEFPRAYGNKRDRGDHNVSAPEDAKDVT
jgi:hypothetical protein